MASKSRRLGKCLGNQSQIFGWHLVYRKDLDRARRVSEYNDEIRHDFPCSWDLYCCDSHSF